MKNLNGNDTKKQNLLKKIFFSLIKRFELKSHHLFDLQTNSF